MVKKYPVLEKFLIGTGPFEAAVRAPYKQGIAGPPRDSDDAKAGWLLTEIGIRLVPHAHYQMTKNSNFRIAGWSVRRYGAYALIRPGAEQNFYVQGA